MYRIVAIAYHSETEEPMVVYQAQYGEEKVWVRPLAMFMEEVDKEKYPDAVQKMRFEPIEQMVEITPISSNPDTLSEEKIEENKEQPLPKEEIEENKEQLLPGEETEENKEQPLPEEETEENVSLDPLLEAYLDTDSYREKLNVLHGLQHRITEHMLNTMAIVIDFELPEGDIQTKYNALHDCLVTKERYECNRVGRFTLG